MERNKSQDESVWFFLFLLVYSTRTVWICLCVYWSFQTSHQLGLPDGIVPNVYSPSFPFSSSSHTIIQQLLQPPLCNDIFFLIYSTRALGQTKVLMRTARLYKHGILLSQDGYTEKLTYKLRSELSPRRVRLPTAVNWLWLKSLQITKKKKGEHQDMKKNHQSVEKRKKKYRKWSILSTTSRSLKFLVRISRRRPVVGRKREKKPGPSGKLNRKRE